MAHSDCFVGRFDFSEDIHVVAVLFPKVLVSKVLVYSCRLCEAVCIMKYNPPSLALETLLKYSIVTVKVSPVLSHNYMYMYNINIRCMYVLNTCRESAQCVFTNYMYSLHAS